MFLKRPFLTAFVALAISSNAFARDIVDMAGRTVTVPDKIESVITLGSVPVINGFIFATGNANLIANDLPQNFRKSGRWIYQDVFAPQLATSPQIQDAEGGPAMEQILTLEPDAAITFARNVADRLQANGIPTVMLRVQTPDEVKSAVALLGDLFDNQAVGKEYAAWFDNTLTEVASRLEKVKDKPSVLYLHPANMTQPHLVAEWWMTTAGGDSITNDGRTEETRSLSTEFILAADPDIIILGEPSHVKKLTEDANLATLRAVKEGRILIAPMGAHIWANRTVEQALTVLWAATNFHPELFSQDELVKKVHDFYEVFFKLDLTNEQINTILSGKS